MNNNSEENTSGHGAAADIPPGVKGWSWGAFLLNWIWGLGNSVYLALLVFIPFVNIVMMFILGFKGREWAWRARQWKSIEHFKKVQRTWSIVAVSLVIATLALTSLSIVLPNILLKKATPTQMAVSMATANTQVVALLGDQIQSHGMNVGDLASYAGGRGSADVSIPLSGTKGSGMLNVKACQLNGKWYVLQLNFISDQNQNIELTPRKKAPCA